MMFLQDFDLTFIHTPGTAMGPADTLSHLPDPDTSSDNADVTLLLANLFIWAIDTVLVNKITSSSSVDPLILNVIKGLHDGSPLFPRSVLTNWQYDAPHLYFKNRLYIPPNAHHDLAAMVHSSLTSGHRCFFCMYSLLSHDYWWPGMSSFVHCFITGCALCQQMKINTHLTIPALSPLSSSCTCPFQQLSVDLITNLPLSNGFDSLMVVADHGLLKGVILTPCNKTIDVKGVAELFFRHVFLCFSLHDHLISDWGPQFTSTFTHELACILGYDLKLFTVYHPQTDGETEQVKKEIETYLQIFCQGQPNKWTDLIPMVEFTHNAATH